MYLLRRSRRPRPCSATGTATAPIRSGCIVRMRASSYLRNSNTLGFADLDFHYGIPTDIPLCGDGMETASTRSASIDPRPVAFLAELEFARVRRCRLRFGLPVTGRSPATGTGTASIRWPCGDRRPAPSTASRVTCGRIPSSGNWWSRIRRARARSIRGLCRRCHHDRRADAGAQQLIRFGTAAHGGADRLVGLRSRPGLGYGAANSPYSACMPPGNWRSSPSRCWPKKSTSSSSRMSIRRCESIEP